MSDRRIAVAAGCLAAALVAGLTIVPDATATSAPHVVRLTGSVASIRTTLPVRSADVRLMFVDSLHTERGSSGPGELFVDSTKSRLTVTDTAGKFIIRDLESGHYLMTVRRIGFSQFQGLIRVDTASVDMELAMEQVDAVLAEYNVTASSTYMDRALRALENTGFTNRAKTSGTGHFVKIDEIMKRKPTRLEDVLSSYGLTSSDIYVVDHVRASFDEIKNYPPEGVLGIEIYRNATTAPIGFQKTTKGRLAMGPGGTGGIQPKFVVLWTYIP